VRDASKSCAIAFPPDLNGGGDSIEALTQPLDIGAGRMFNNLADPNADPRRSPRLSSAGSPGAGCAASPSCHLTTPMNSSSRAIHGGPSDAQG
jgi:hypothetical protein